MNNVKARGTKDEVFNGLAIQTAGGLKKEDLIKNKKGVVVSKKMSEAAKARYPAMVAVLCKKRGLTECTKCEMTQDPPAEIEKVQAKEAPEKRTAFIKRIKPLQGDDIKKVTETLPYEKSEVKPLEKSEVKPYAQAVNNIIYPDPEKNQEYIRQVQEATLPRGDPLTMDELRRLIWRVIEIHTPNYALTGAANKQHKSKLFNIVKNYIEYYTDRYEISEYHAASMINGDLLRDQAKKYGFTLI